LKSSLHSQIKKNDQQLKGFYTQCQYKFFKRVPCSHLYRATPSERNGIKSGGGGGWLASNIVETIDAKDSNKKKRKHF
jgi:hypothetical protein